MAVTYGFFNSVNQDRLYNADQMSEYFKGLVSDGVYESVGDALQVVANSGMTVNVKTGRAIIDCKWLENDAIMPLTITQSHPTLNRYTAVVVRLDVSNRLMEITTVDGTPASSPTQPSITNTDLVMEICLAMIYVGAGVTNITQAYIKDMRASSSCGWVTGLIEQVDTSTLFMQWQTAYEEFYQSFESWFDTLTSELQVNTYITRTYADYTVTKNNTTYVDLPTSLNYVVGDILDVYVGGILLSPTEYTIMKNEVTGGYMIRVNNDLDSGNILTFLCLKSKVGEPNNAETVAF